MKKVEAIIRHIKLDEVKTALDEIGIKWMTVTDVKGAGKQKGYTEQWRGSKLNIFLNPKLELKIVVKDELVPKVIDTIMAVARTGAIGDGKIFITNVEEAVAIRTGARGEEAL